MGFLSCCEKDRLYNHPLFGTSKRRLVERIIDQEDQLEEWKEKEKRWLKEKEDLEERLKFLTPPPKTSENSSLPPSTQTKPAVKAAPRWGAKPKHRGFGYQRREPDRILHVELNACPCCSHRLDDVPVQNTQIHQIVDVQFVTTVTDYKLERKICPDCGKNVAAQAPEPWNYSSTLRGLIVYWHTRQHLSQDRIRQSLMDLFDLKVSKGTINAVLSRPPMLLEQEIDKLRAQVKAESGVLGVDETGFRVAGQNQWLWVFQTEAYSLFEINASRSGEVVFQTLGETFDGVLVTDFYAAYNVVDGEKQKCWAHLLRELKFIEQAEPESAKFCEKIRQTFFFAQKIPPDLSEETHNALKIELKTDFQRLLAEKVTGKNAIRIQKRLHKYQNELFLFIERPEVPATNNASERAIRPAVVHRKVVQDYRTNHGAAAYTAWHSFNETNKKQDQPVFQTLVNLYNQSV